MDHDTLTLCREAYDTYSRGDFAGLMEFFDPDIEVYFERDDVVRALEQRSAEKSRAEPADQPARP